MRFPTPQALSAPPPRLAGLFRGLHSRRQLFANAAIASSRHEAGRCRPASHRMRKLPSSNSQDPAQRHCGGSLVCARQVVQTALAPKAEAHPRSCYVAQVPIADIRPGASLSSDRSKKR
jgi:hypothetical protein